MRGVKKRSGEGKQWDGGYVLVTKNEGKQERRAVQEKTKAKEERKE